LDGGHKMIRFKLVEKMSDKGFRENRRVTIQEVAEETGINRMTLSRLINKRGCNSTTDNLNKLCEFFECDISEIVEYYPDGQVK